MRARKRAADAARKHAYIDKYIPHIGDALQDILGLTDRKRDDTVDVLRDILKKSRKL